jgi:predicted O-methyltransferase YrrM
MAVDPGDSLGQLATSMPSPEVARRWRSYVERHLEGFAEAMRRIPIPPGPGSMSTSEAFWLFRLVTELQPSAIVDSGSATGWSAFVMAAAAPDARLHCCDPYRRPAALPDAAEYHDRDWTKSRIDLPLGTFVLFDDHVNQRRRTLQARGAGITDVVFHDVYRVPTKSTVSLAFVDLIGLAKLCHTFDPLWFVDPIFMNTSTNKQMYRWLTWLQLTPYPGLRVLPRVRAAAQRRLLRNPAADQRSKLNWGARG